MLSSAASKERSSMSASALLDRLDQSSVERIKTDENELLLTLEPFELKVEIHVKYSDGVCQSVYMCPRVDAYTTEDLVFEWRKDAVPVEKNDDIRLPEYELIDVSHMVCSQNINSTG